MKQRVSRCEGGKDVENKDTYVRGKDFERALWRRRWRLCIRLRPRWRVDGWHRRGRVPTSAHTPLQQY